MLEETEEKLGNATKRSISFRYAHWLPVGEIVRRAQAFDGCDQNHRASNLFYEICEPFKEGYDNFRDDHVWFILYKFSPDSLLTS